MLATLQVARRDAVHSDARCPNFTTGTGSFGVERTAYFDEHARAGRMKGTRGGTQPTGYLMPAPTTCSSNARA